MQLQSTEQSGELKNILFNLQASCPSYELVMSSQPMAVTAVLLWVSRKLPVDRSPELEVPR